MKGSVDSIETFGLVDGPGIRTVIFLNGCSLRCKFCHNPETWKVQELNFTSDEIVEKVKRNKPYFNNGGGVTFSGGEPLIQYDFLIDCCKKLKKENIHIALDTAGIGLGNYDELFDNIDMVLLDIKHINPEKSKELVGASNEKELAFAKYLSDNNIPIWIRQVIVPGITDNEDDLIKLKDFISSLKTVKNIELLPYHNLGKHKWETLGFEYKLKDVRQATNDDVNRAKTILGIN